MKNVNKDYLVEVNVKTAEIKAPKDMKFHITDIYTCNIFFKLVFDEPKRTTDKISISDYFDKSYMPKEDIGLYSLTLRILKPNGEPIDRVEVKQPDSNSDFLYADLEPDYLDMIGSYECELFISAAVNGRMERSTTDSFNFKVVKSIFTDLSEAIKKDPDYPLLADVYATKDYVHSATKTYVDYTIDNLDLKGYATRDYVNSVALSNINIDLSDYVKSKDLEIILSGFESAPGGDDNDNNIDLSGFVTNEMLESSISTISNRFANYALKSYVDEQIATVTSGGTIDLTGYVKSEELEQKLTYKADVVHDHEDIHVTWAYMYQEDFIPRKEMPDSLPANGGHADTCSNADYAELAINSNDSYKVCGYRIYVLTQGEYDLLGDSIDHDTLYFIKEEEE